MIYLIVVCQNILNICWRTCVFGGGRSCPGAAEPGTALLAGTTHRAGGCKCLSGMIVLASQSEEEGMAALGAVHWIIFIIEVQDIFLRFETKLLVQQHGRITGRHVQRHVFAHARLKDSNHTTA